jgi:prolyl oligopeptidase
VKQGGERTGIFEIFDVRNHTVFPDSLPHGFLRAFAFASDGKSFYYVHEPTNATRPFPAAVYHHALGIPFIADQRLFSAPEGGNPRLTIIPGRRSIGLLIQRFLKGTSTDFYVSRMGNGTAVSILRNADYRFAPRIVGGRILATTNRDAPNRRIVEIQPRRNQDPLFFDVIPEGNAPIRAWYVTANYILVSYSRPAQTQTHIFDSYGKRLGQIPSGVFETLRVLAADWDDDDVLLERESFAQPIEIERYSLTTGACTRWAQREVPIEAAAYKCAAVSYPSRDRTNIPLSLVGKSELFVTGTHPVAMTAYGGYGVPATPQFSVFVAFLIERGCLFALPNIRGGSEFGVEWHHAAKRQNRQVAIDDFLSAAEWLIETGRTTAEKLAIFGGSNSGLLVGAALTQRPHLFRAVLCMVPMLDMLRYELFDNAHVWNDEFGTIDDIDDFRSLAKYSPYHAVRPDQTYPATMFVSGDADQNCNPLHARKMTARLQAANASHTPIFLDYSPHRGHSPVLPLTERVNALTDRLAFFCNQLGLGV